MKKDKLKMAMASGSRGGSGWYRIYLPAKHMKIRNLHDVRSRYDMELTEAEGCDVLVLQRPFRPEVLRQVKSIQKSGTVVVYEIDDDIWSMEERNPNVRNWNEEITKHATEFMAECDAVIASTETLAKKIHSRTGHRLIRTIPNYIEDCHFEPQQRSSKETVRIGWAGGDSHSPDFEDTGCAEALLRLKEKYGPRVDVVVFGECPEQLIGRVRTFEPVPPHEYLERLHWMNFDVAIAPLADNEFNRSKGIMKVVEYAMVRVPIIACSADRAYGRMSGFSVIDGKWFEYLEELCAIMSEGDGITVDEDYEGIRRDYLIEDHVYDIARTYSEIYELSMENRA